MKFYKNTQYYDSLNIGVQPSFMVESHHKVAVLSSSIACPGKIWAPRLGKIVAKLRASW